MAVYDYPYTWALFGFSYCSHPVKIDLDKKLDPKQKTIQKFNIDAHSLEKQKMKILRRRN